VAEIRALLDQDLQADAERAAHTLKGVAGTLGVMHVQEVAGAAERAIRDRAPGERIEAALLDIESALGPVVSELRNALPEPAPAAVSASTAVDPAQVQAAVDELIRLLADFDADAVGFIEDHDPLLRTIFTPDAWSRFVQRAQAFDFPEALALVENAARERGFAAS
jgi:HPt (histidine-containing phosphotransfer) domain-containing protein